MGGSGIVIAGYGDDEYFPSFIKHQTDGFLPCGIRLLDRRVTSIAHDNLSTIEAFAQGDMAAVFMTGIDQVYQGYIERTLTGIVKKWPDISASTLGIDPKKKVAEMRTLRNAIEAGIKEARDGMKDYRQRRFVNPVLEALQYLDKSELGMMAESLVALTALKRRVSLSEETVGGPVDVAVISKGDGFIWLKRKHYFDETLNRTFIQRYLPYDTKEGQSLSRSRR